MAQSLGSMPWTVGRRLRFLGCKMGRGVLSGTFGQLPCGEWVSGEYLRAHGEAGSWWEGPEDASVPFPAWGLAPAPPPTPPRAGVPGSEGLLEAGDPHAGSVSKGDGLLSGLHSVD